MLGIFLLFLLFTLHSFIGNIQSQLFAEREITVFETLRNVSVITNTKTSCPQVHVELIDNELRTKFDGHETWFEFKNPVRWPSTISIDANGICDVTFNKRRHMHWNKDSIKKLNKSDVPLASVFPEYWMVEVVDNTNLTHDTCLLTVRYYNDVFNFVGPGQHLTIRQKVTGKVKKYQYTPVPMLPIVNPDNPNPGPGKSFLSNSLTHLIVKAYPQGTLSKWLCSVDMGEFIFVSEPQGTFCPTTELKGKKQIYLLAAGTGLTPMLSVILWVLQTTRKTKLHLIFFNRYEEDIIWRKEIDETTYVDGRFTVEYVLSRPSETWKGRQGRISVEMLKEMFPMFDKSSDSRFNYFGLCGQYEFSTQTEKWLTEDMGYPKKDVYKFMGQ